MAKKGDKDTEAAQAEQAEQERPPGKPLSQVEGEALSAQEEPRVLHPEEETAAAKPASGRDGGKDDSG